MLIRNYKNEDVNEINKLGRLLHKKYCFSIDGFSNCIVIEESKEIIGFIIYSIIYERSEIIDIIIDPTKRGQGYGSKLLNQAINVINENNCENITLEVNSLNNAAINLYKKFGFNVVAVRKKYYNENDGYLMKKDLR